MDQHRLGAHLAPTSTKKRPPPPRYWGGGGSFSVCTHRVPTQEYRAVESLTFQCLVEMRGIEPRSDGGATGLLRVQLAAAFLSPGVSREQGRRRAQSPKSPEVPGDEGPQQWLPR